MSFKYILVDQLPYAAVVSESDFTNYYDEVCKEFTASRKEYLYVHHTRSATLLHFTTEDKVDSIMQKGLVPGSEFCDVGSAVYAYRASTPIEDMFPLQKSWDSPSIVSPTVIVEFVANEYYQCVHCVETHAPLRYCVVRGNVSPSAISQVHYNVETAHRACSSKDFIHSMGYPYEVVQAIPVECFEENSVVKALRYLNDTPLSEIMKDAPKPVWTVTLSDEERELLKDSLFRYNTREHNYAEGRQGLADSLVLKLLSATPGL